jgi:CDP-diacylglycerol--glycerol-3-phosphate 3-phosphatidyltransferase
VAAAPRSPAPVPEGRGGVPEVRPGSAPVVAVRSRARITLVGSTTTLRFALTPVIAALALTGSDLVAAIVFALAAGTDYIDGFLARRWGVTTATGSFLDTTADKVLVAGVLIALAGSAQASPWPVLIIVCRELVVMGLRGSVAVSGTVITASQLGRSKAAVQFLAVVLVLLRVNQPVGPLGVSAWALWAAVALSVVSGVDYLYRWAGVIVRGSRVEPD